MELSGAIVSHSETVACHETSNEGSISCVCNKYVSIFCLFVKKLLRCF